MSTSSKTPSRHQGTGQCPRGEQRLIGRGGELAALRELVASAATGRGAVAWVEGEPGIGKSALLRAGLAAGPQLGCTLLPAAGDELPGDPASLRAIRNWLDPVQARPPAVRAPVIVAVDDMQRADEESLAAWDRLALLARRLPLLLVAAARPVPLRQELSGVRAAALGRGATLISLGPLGSDDAAALAERQLRSAGYQLPGDAGRPWSALAALAGGNPRYLIDLANALAADGWPAEPGPEQGPAHPHQLRARLPASAAAVITGRLGFLSPAAREALRWAALLGMRFSPAELSIVTGKAAGELIALLEEAAAAGVLAEAGTRLAFRHPVVRHALCEAMPAAVRDTLHLAAARALAQAEAPCERVAAQLACAAEIDYGWVWAWLRQAAPALARRDPPTATGLLHRALAQRPAGGTERSGGLRDTLHQALATALFALGRHQELEVLARRALAAPGDPGHAAAVAWQLAYALGWAGRYDEASLVTTQALASSELTAAAAARLHALQALHEAEAGQPVPGAPLAGQAALRAAEQARRTGEQAALGVALHAQGVAAVRRGHYADGLRLADAALEATGPARDETAGLALRVLAGKIMVLTELGGTRQAGDAAAEAVRLASQAPGPEAAVARVMTAAHYFTAGRWPEAATELERAAEPPDDRCASARHALLALLAGHRDERAAATGTAQDAAARPAAAPSALSVDLLAAAGALAAERDGRTADAVAGLAALLRRGASGARCLWLPQLARLALADGQRRTAQAAADAAAGTARAMAAGAWLASADHCRGLVTADAALLASVAERYHRAGVPLLRGWALEDAAVTLAAAGQLAQARSAYAAAVQVYAGLGAAWDMRRAAARLRGYGVRGASRPAARRPATGWAALTAAEATVARLVSEGKSNPEIAAELFLSRATVKTHVSSILRKLRVSSRAEIAREAARRLAAGDRRRLQPPLGDQGIVRLQRRRHVGAAVRVGGDPDQRDEPAKSLDRVRERVKRVRHRQVE
jgi:DNA-binding CsgD family transcriptional regulator